MERGVQILITIFTVILGLALFYLTLLGAECLRKGLCP